MGLSCFNTFIKAQKVMTLVLCLLRINTNSLLALGKQEQQLDYNSLYSFSSNPYIRIPIDVRNTEKQLNKFLEDKVIKSKDGIVNSELSVKAMAPYFIPNSSKLLDFLVCYLHKSNEHCGLAKIVAGVCGLA